MELVLACRLCPRVSAVKSYCVGAYGYFLSLTGATVTLDGKPVVENGQLKI